MVKTSNCGEETTLEVVGALTGDAVEKLERSWREAAGRCRLDLRSAADIDEPGKRLIAEMFASGVELVIAAHAARIQ